MKEKNRPGNANRESYVKHCSDTKKSMVETRKFYIKLFLSISIRENSSHPARFFAGTSVLLLLDTIDALGFSFFISSQNTKEKLLYCLHTLSHKCLKSFDLIILLQSVTILLCKAS